MNYKHRLEFKVRDYECDMQGLLNRGINFAEMTSSGIHLLVVRAELDYQKPLKSNDEFVVCSNFRQVSKLRFAFLQDIYRCRDQQLMLQAKIIGTSVNQRGRPFASEELLLLLGD